MNVCENQLKENEISDLKETSLCEEKCISGSNERKLVKKNDKSFDQENSDERYLQKNYHQREMLLHPSSAKNMKTINNCLNLPELIGRREKLV